MRHAGGQAYEELNNQTHGHRIRDAGGQAYKELNNQEIRQTDIQ